MCNSLSHSPARATLRILSQPHPYYCLEVEFHKTLCLEWKAQVSKAYSRLTVSENRFETLAAGAWLGCDANLPSGS